MTKLIDIVLIITAGIYMCGCAPTTPNSDLQLHDSKRESVYRVAIDQSLRRLDPIKYDDAGSSLVANQIYCTLLYQTSTFELKKHLVKDWTVDQSRRKYHFVLNDGVKFSDGSPIKADDVVASINRLRRPDSILASDYGKVADISAENDKEFIIELKEPYPMFLYQLASINSAILSREYINRAESDDFKNPVGCGPFAVESIDNNKIILLKNRYYHGSVKLDKLVFSFIYDDEQAIKAFNRGELDDISDYNIDPSRIDGSIPIRIHETLPFYTYFLNINANRPPFDDKCLRHKFIDSLRREDLFGLIKSPGLEIANGLIPRGIIGYSEESRLYDGFADGKECNLNSKMQYPLRVTLAASDRYRVKDIQNSFDNEQMRKYFEVDVKYLRNDEMADYYENRKSDIMFIGDALRFGDPFFLLSYFKSDNAYNDTGVKSKVIDQLLDEAARTESKYARAKIYSRIDKEIEQEAVVYPIYYGNEATGIVRANISGLDDMYGNLFSRSYANVQITDDNEAN